MQNLPDTTHGSQNPNKKQIGIKTEYLYTGIVMSLIICMIALITLDFFGVISLKSFFQIPADQKLSQASLNGSANPENKIEHVGGEYIYQKEMNTELSYFPPEKNIDVRSLLLKKMQKDSIILQSAQKQGLITLDSSVFNSPDINYRKRMQLVQLVKKDIIAMQDSISGDVLFIWFDNEHPGPIGYEKGKEIALATITDLYNKVKSGQMTMDEAGQAIIQNSNLAQVDPAFKSNAIEVFKAGPTDKITYDPRFDSIIRALSPGEMTNMYVGSDHDLSGNVYQAVYMFAKVTAKTAAGHPENFNQWYTQAQKNYENTMQ